MEANINSSIGGISSSFQFQFQINNRIKFSAKVLCLGQPANFKFYSQHDAVEQMLGK